MAAPAADEGSWLNDASERALHAALDALLPLLDTRRVCTACAVSRGWRRVFGAPRCFARLTVLREPPPERGPPPAALTDGRLLQLVERARGGTTAVLLLGSTRVTDAGVAALRHGAPLLREVDLRGSRASVHGACLALCGADELHGVLGALRGAARDAGAARRAAVALSAAASVPERSSSDDDDLYHSSSSSEEEDNELTQQLFSEDVCAPSCDDVAAALAAAAEAHASNADTVAAVLSAAAALAHAAMRRDFASRPARRDLHLRRGLRAALRDAVVPSAAAALAAWTPRAQAAGGARDAALHACRALWTLLAVHLPGNAAAAAAAAAAGAEQHLGVLVRECGDASSSYDCKFVVAAVRALAAVAFGAAQHDAAEQSFLSERVAFEAAQRARAAVACTRALRDSVLRALRHADAAWYDWYEGGDDAFALLAVVAAAPELACLGPVAHAALQLAMRQPRCHAGLPGHMLPMALRAVRALADAPSRPREDAAHAVEVGIAGLHMTHELLNARGDDDLFVVTAEEAAAEGTVRLLAGAVEALYAIAGSKGSDGKRTPAGGAALWALERTLNCAHVLCSLVDRRESAVQCLALIQECIPRLHAALDRWERDPMSETRLSSSPHHNSRWELAMWLEAMTHSMRYHVTNTGAGNSNEATAALIRDAGATAVVLRALELRGSSFIDPAYSLLLLLFPKATAPKATAAQAAPLRELLMLLCCSLDAAGEVDLPLRKKVSNALHYLPARKSR